MPHGAPEGHDRAQEDLQNAYREHYTKLFLRVIDPIDPTVRI